MHEYKPMYAVRVQPLQSPARGGGALDDVAQLFYIEDRWSTVPKFRLRHELNRTIQQWCNNRT